MMGDLGSSPCVSASTREGSRLPVRMAAAIIWMSHGALPQAAARTRAWGPSLGVPVMTFRNPKASSLQNKARNQCQGAGNVCHGRSNNPQHEVRLQDMPCPACAVLVQVACL